MSPTINLTQTPFLAGLVNAHGLNIVRIISCGLVIRTNLPKKKIFFFNTTENGPGVELTETNGPGASSKSEELIIVGRYFPDSRTICFRLDYTTFFYRPRHTKNSPRVLYFVVGVIIAGTCFLFSSSGGWMGKNKALAHHTSTYFHTRRVSIFNSDRCFRIPTLAGAPFGSQCRYSVSCPYYWSSLQPRQRKLPLYTYACVCRPGLSPEGQVRWR